MEEHLTHSNAWSYLHCASLLCTLKQLSEVKRYKDKMYAIPTERERAIQSIRRHTFSSNSYSVSIGVNVCTDFDAHILVPVTVTQHRKLLVDKSNQHYQILQRGRFQCMIHATNHKALEGTILYPISYTITAWSYAFNHRI